MIYLHSYDITQGNVHDFYNPIDSKFYSVTETVNINFYVITENGAQSTIPFTYALPKKYYYITYNSRFDELENSKLRIILNSI